MRRERRSQKGSWRVQRSGIKSIPVLGCCCRRNNILSIPLYPSPRPERVRIWEQHLPAALHSPQTAGMEGTSLSQTLKYQLWKICLSCNYKNLCGAQDDTGFGSLVTEMLSSAEHLGMEIFLEWFCKQHKNPEQ